ncbi:MAG: hypothetical protein JW854_00505 [Actinobacteria bacterium]|nr:hypothetical protein [Actinomycetota bacterium]
MRRYLIVLLGIVVCLALSAPLLAVSSPAPEGGEFQADAVSAASPNYRTFTEAELKSMNKYTQTLDGGGDIVSISETLAGGHYGCQKSSDPYTYFEQDWKGVDLSYLLEQEVGIKGDTTGIRVIAEDGYAVTLTLDQIRGNSNPSGLPTLLGYMYGESSADNPGAPNGAGFPYVAPKPADNELSAADGGPFRLILPQKVEGPAVENAAYDSPAGNGEMNWNKAVMWVRAIEVQPVPPGIPALDAAAIPENEVVVYGNILNRKTLTVDQLKCMESFSGTYHYRKSNFAPPPDYFEEDHECTGATLQYLLDDVIGLQDTATDVNVIATDDYDRTFTLDQVRQVCPNNLMQLLCYNYDGADLGPEPGDDGPIYFIKPLETTDPTETNNKYWIKNVRVIEVEPLGIDPGPDPTQIPTDRVIFCGAIDAGNVPNEWYFAEGCTGFGFETWLSIANPNPWESEVLVDYFIEGEAPQQQTLMVPARTRTTINVGAVVGPDKNVSARVEGYHGDSIVAERAMYWNGRVGGHCASGVNAPAGQWYLAEGATAGGFETWVLLQNPGTEDATVNMTYMTGTGEVAGSPVAVPAQSRKTVNIATDGVADNYDVSTMVASDKPIIAERAMYWNDKVAGHCSSGVTAAADQWYLAEGATDGGFETWVLLQNPNDDAVTVDLTFMTGAGPVAPPDLQDFGLAPNTRFSFNVGNYVTDYNVSTMVASEGGGIIAERAMYWNDKNGGHNAHGLEYAKFRSFLAEGCTAGGFETWVLLQNPGPCGAEVSITYQTEAGAMERDPILVGAGSRVSINVGMDIGETYDVSTLVNSSAPIVVERAVYWNSKVEGTCSTGYQAW